MEGLQRSKNRFDSSAKAILNFQTHKAHKGAMLNQDTSTLKNHKSHLEEELEQYQANQHHKLAMMGQHIIGNKSNKNQFTRSRYTQESHMLDSGFRSSTYKEGPLAGSAAGSKHFFGAKSRSIQLKGYQSEGPDSELKITKRSSMEQAKTSHFEQRVMSMDLKNSQQILNLISNRKVIINSSVANSGPDLNIDRDPSAEGSNIQETTNATGSRLSSNIQMKVNSEQTLKFAFQGGISPVEDKQVPEIEKNENSQEKEEVLINESDHEEPMESQKHTTSPFVANHSSQRFLSPVQSSDTAMSNQTHLVVTEPVSPTFLKKQIKVRNQINNYSLDQAQRFAKMISPEKFEQICLKDALEMQSKMKFQNGQKILQDWKSNITQKYEKRQYYHLMREGEKTERDAKKQYVEKLSVLEELARGDKLEKINNSAEAQYKAEFDKKKKKFNVIAATSIFESPKRRIELRFLTAEKVNLMNPTVPAKYLMNKESGIGESKTLKQASASKKDASKITKIVGQEESSGGLAGSLKAGFVGKVMFSSNDADNHNDQGDGFDPLVKLLLKQHIDYSCPEFKEVMRQGFALVKRCSSNIGKGKEVSIQEQLRLLDNEKFNKALDKYMVFLNLKLNFQDKQFLKERYKNLTPGEKKAQKQIDYQNFEQPETLISQNVSNYIKLKLKKAIFDPIKTLFEDDLVTKQDILAPQKQYQADLYVEEVIKRLMKEFETNEFKETHTEEEVEEIKRNYEHTQTITSQVRKDSNIDDYKVQILALELKKHQFREKIANSQMNANLEVHQRGRYVDPEIVNLIKETLAKEYPKGSTKYDYTEPKLEEDQLDIDSLFLKMCEERYLLPVVNVLTRLTNSQDKELTQEIVDFRMSTSWTDIIVRILQEQTQRLQYTKHLILKSNAIKDPDFSRILEELEIQEQLSSITFHHNELGPWSLRRLDSILTTKNLQIFSLKSPKIKKDEVMDLLDIIQRSATLTSLELVNIAFLNTDEAFYTLVENLKMLYELKHLNISDNNLKTHHLADLVDSIRENPSVELKSLNLSRNYLRQMPFKSNDEEEALEYLQDLRKQFYAGIADLIERYGILDLNLDNMHLGNEAVCLCHSVVRSVSLITLHLSYNGIDAETVSQIKWFLSVGVKLEDQPQNSRIENNHKLKVFMHTKLGKKIKDQAQFNEEYKDQLDSETQSVPKHSPRLIKPITNVLKGLADIEEKKAFMVQQMRLHPEMNKQEFLYDQLNGSKLLLTRVLGHKEFLHPEKTLFSFDQIQKSKQYIEKFVQAENKNERLKKPAVVGAKYLYVNEVKHTEERAKIQEKFEEAVVKTRSEDAQKIADERYSAERNCTQWTIQSECWHCEKYRQIVIFFQRSLAHVWFRQEPEDAKLEAVLPAEIVGAYRRKIMALNRDSKPNPYSLPPLVFANFDVYSHKTMCNPIELSEAFIQDRVIKITHDAMAEFKENLGKRFVKDQVGTVDAAMVKEVYDIHFMVNYNQALANETFGDKWLHHLLSQLRYPQDTEFLNCPNVFNMKESDKVNLESACINQDLFVSSGFIKPGKNTIRILDNKLNKITNKLELVCYKKEIMIEHRTADILNLLSQDEVECMELIKPLVRRYEAILQQNKQDIIDKIEEEKRLAIEKAEAERLQQEEQDRLAKEKSKEKNAGGKKKK